MTVPWPRPVPACPSSRRPRRIRPPSSWTIWNGWYAAAARVPKPRRPSMSGGAGPEAGAAGHARRRGAAERARAEVLRAESELGELAAAVARHAAELADH